MNEPAKSVLRDTTPEVIAEAWAIIAGATHAALATLEPGSGDPIASRVGLATLDDGTPLMIASALTAHSKALRADPRCSLLVGEPGKGDPLAHPRITLKCRAQILEPASAAVLEARARYLAHNPKAGLYIDLPDFRFFRLDMVSASFNGGFGRAFVIDGAALRG